MYKWSIEIRPVICQEIEADTWEKAKEKIKETFEDHPVVLTEIDDCEIYDVTPPNAKAQEILNRLQKVIEYIERFSTPDSFDIKNVSFKDDEYEDDPEEWMESPRYIYADIHTYDGAGGHIIEKDIEYDVKRLLEIEKKEM